MASVMVSHVQYSPNNSFEEYIARFERQLGRPDAGAYEEKLKRGNEQEVRSLIKAQEGTSGLMLFAAYDYGALLQTKVALRKARLYMVGNPLLTTRLANQDLRAAFYLPVRILVYGDRSNRVQVEYEQFSSCVAPLQNGEVDRAARELDVTLANLVQGASEDFM